MSDNLRKVVPVEDLVQDDENLELDENVGYEGEVKQNENENIDNLVKQRTWFEDLRDFFANLKYEGKYKFLNFLF